MNEAEIQALLKLLPVAYTLVNGLIARLKAHGVTDEQIAAATEDYTARIERAEREAQ